MPTHQLVFGCAPFGHCGQSVDSSGTLADWKRAGFSVAEVEAGTNAVEQAARATEAGMMPLLCCAAETSDELDRHLALAKRIGALAVCVRAGSGKQQPVRIGGLAAALSGIALNGGTPVLLDVPCGGASPNLDHPPLVGDATGRIRVRLDLTVGEPPPGERSAEPNLPQLLDRVDMIRASDTTCDVAVRAEAMRLWRRRTPPGRWMVFSAIAPSECDPDERLHACGKARELAMTAWAMSATATAPIWP